MAYPPYEYSGVLNLARGRRADPAILFDTPGRSTRMTPPIFWNDGRPLPMRSHFRRTTPPVNGPA